MSLSFFFDFSPMYFQTVMYDIPSDQIGDIENE